MATATYALCDATGVITFAPRIPHDLRALPIARGPRKKLIAAITGVARHAYDGETLLVPGVPEASDQTAALDALLRFKEWIGPSFAKQGLDVEFPVARKRRRKAA